MNKYNQKEISLNLIDFYEYFARKNQLKYSYDDDIFWVRNAPGVWPNWTISNSESEDFEKVVDWNIKKVIAREIPAYWNVFPGISQYQVIDRLEGAGFREIFRWKGMALNLEEFEAQKNEVTGLEVRLINNGKDMDHFVDMLNDILLDANQLSKKDMHNFIGDKKFLFFLGYLHNQMVSTAMINLRDDVAGVYMVTTLPAFRNKGIGTAMTNEALACAIERNATRAVLHASKMGEPIYRKMGFKEYNLYRIFWLVGKQYR